jgi:hypothetical protein
MAKAATSRKAARTAAKPAAKAAPKKAKAPRGAARKAAKAPPSRPAATTRRVTFHLLVEDKPGVIQRVAAVFAGRGVSMDAVLAHRTLGLDGEKSAEVTVTVMASPTREKMIGRALERVRLVRRVLVIEEDSPRIAEAAVVEVRPGTGAPFFDGVSCFPVDAPRGAPRRLLLYGRPVKVLAAIGVLRDAGILLSARFTRFLLDEETPPMASPA